MSRGSRSLIGRGNLSASILGKICPLGAARRGLQASDTEEDMLKSIALKLMKNPQARRLGIQLLKNPRVQREIMKQVSRRFGRR